MECNGERHIFEGVAVCEKKSVTSPNIQVKIMPVPGRVVFSDGISKKPIDFNYRTGGWIWKETIIDTTWVPIDIGEMNSIFGDVPIAFDVQGTTDSGVINNRGVIYTRICNDKDIPCSKLVVQYDCAGKVQATSPGHIGSCSRMSGSSQKFSIPLTPAMLKGAQIRVHSPRDGWSFEHEVSAPELLAGEVKFVYPNVLTGPDLLSLTVFNWEQGVLTEYHAYVLLVGFSPNWTGIDRPHHVQTDASTFDICLPVLADLLEISAGKNISVLTKGCQTWRADSSDQLCAFAFDRESGDQTYSCLKNGKDVRFP